MCEDYPCCGHADGLGCDWVSPNEVIVCQVCIDARANYPYHSALDTCPSRESVSMAQFLATTDKAIDQACESCQEDANGVWSDLFWCLSCWEDARIQAEMSREEDWANADY